MSADVPEWGKASVGEWHSHYSETSWEAGFLWLIIDSKQWTATSTAWLYIIMIYYALDLDYDVGQQLIKDV